MSQHIYTRLSPEYFQQQFEQPVMFWQTVRGLLKDKPDTILIDIGAKAVVTMYLHACDEVDMSNVVTVGCT